HVLHIRWRRLQDHLKLVIVLQPVRILAVAPILRPPRRLYIRRAPRPRTQRAQGRRGMKCARAHLHIVRLQNEAALLRPEILEREDQVLKCARLVHDSPELPERAETSRESPRSQALRLRAKW